MVTNHAPASSTVFILPSGDMAATRMGMPRLTASPPRLAMNMRTEVRMVISLVSRVRLALSAP